MGYLTKYGTAWGNVPETSGNIYYVAPSSSATISGYTVSASDNNDGLSPERPLASIQQAISNASANSGDVIMLLPGTHTSAATVTLSKAGITFVGAHPQTRVSPSSRGLALASKVNWTSTFAGVGITNTASDCTFVGINFIPVTAQSMMTLIAANRPAFIDCSLTLSAATSTSTKGFVFSGASAVFPSFTNCFFYNPVGVQGPALDLTGCDHYFIDKCTFLVDTGTWAVAALVATGQGVFRDNDFVTGASGVMTVGISGTGATTAKASLALRNSFGVSPGAGGISLFSTGTYIELVNNYLATVSGGSGSTLLTTNS